MNTHYQPCNSCSPGPLGASLYVESEHSASPPPEIAICPAVEDQAYEIDENTGLPKLPVEFPQPGSPEVVRSEHLRNLKKANQPASALKMNSNISTSPRKSVTFEPAAGDKPPAMSKQPSDSVVLRDQIRQAKRVNGRPTSLPNRSRSVFIRLLQPPRGTTTPTLHKRSAGNDPLTPIPNVESLPSVVRAEEDQASSSPVFSRFDSRRRSSFLYQQGEDMREEGGRFLGGEDFVTPFAQILSTLHRVRADYLALVGLPEDTKTQYTRPPNSTPTSSPAQDRRFPNVPEKKAAMGLLEDLDWSLKMLETVNSNQSMGNVTGDKIKRLLNRELSHLSEGCQNGAEVAEWVTDITSSDPYDVDRIGSASAKLCGEEEMESVLSASHSHDNWTRRLREQRVPGRRVTLEAESVPKFGVEVGEEHREEMEEYMRTKLHVWSVDLFHFNSITGGNSLVSASYMLFKRRNLFTEMHISPHTFINYITSIQNSYHSSNPYHNAMHATDVMLTTNQLLNANNLEGVFSQVEVMAALVAAAVHDVDHPGVTNPYLVAIRHDLAIMYNDNSVLENHHAAFAFKTLQKPKCNFLEHLDSDCVQLFRRAVIDMVLSTDMAKHIGNVADMKTLMETKKLTNDGLLSLGNYKENSAVLKCLIHCADLSNPTKEPSLAANWSYRIMEESFKQGDREKELGIAVHAIGDRETVSIPRCQITFIDLIIYPLWETWAELVYPDAQHVMENLALTKSYWCELADRKEGVKVLSDSDGERGTSPRILDPSPEPVHKKPSSPELFGSNSFSKSSTEESEEGLSFNCAAKSESFEKSPASERRLSYKSVKGTPMAQGISHSLFES